MKVQIGNVQVRRKRNHKDIRKVCMAVALALGILLSIYGNGGIFKVQAATPRVMLTDYEIVEGTVTSGSPFTLKVTLGNKAVRTSVRNLKVTVISENGEFLPAEGAGTAYIDKIDASTEAELDFHMVAVDGLEEKSYKVSIKTEYEDPSGNPYEVTDAIYLPIRLAQRMLISDVYLADYDLQLGDTVEISALVNNLGAGTLYNVKVKVEGDNVMEQDSYIGNIASGKSGTVDILTKADMVSHNVGDKNKLIVTYEDKAGQVSTKEWEMDSITVAKPIYENLEKVKDSPDVTEIVKKVVLVAAGIAVVVLMIILLRRHHIRKQKLLDEI